MLGLSERSGYAKTKTAKLEAHASFTYGKWTRLSHAKK